MFKKNKAFTLIELLVVIAIIGILSTLAVVALQSSRADSRDAKRLADVRQIQKALEMYFLENGSYPSDISSGIASGTTIYMAQIPVAPTPADGNCPSYNNTYTYVASSSSYTLDFCLGSKTGEFDAGGKRATNEGIISYTPPVPWVCGLAFTDDRDSQQYGTVQIGTQCWMTKNMNYDDGCASNTWVNSSDVRWCGCYSGNSSNCTTFGKLYQWSAVMAGTTTVGAQGICPAGWHVPTQTEIDAMIAYVNTQYSCEGSSINSGKAFSATSTWSVSGTSCTVGNTLATNNSTGFNLLPSGFRDTSGNYQSINSNTKIWASNMNSGNALRYDLSNSSWRFTYGYDSKAYGLSVRCIKN